MIALTLISTKNFNMNIVGFMLLIRCASSKLDVCWVFVWPGMKDQFLIRVGLVYCILSTRTT